jgi:thiol:disulfide interchange protein DsbA
VLLSTGSNVFSAESTGHIVLPLKSIVEKKQGKIEVLEFYWLECGHCNKLEPKLKQWVEKNSARINFVRVPVAFRPQYISQQKLYYVLAEMNVIDDLHDKAFHYIHVEHQPFVSERAIVSFIKKNGVDGEKFINLYQSERIRDKVLAADKLREKFGIDSVPTLVVDGRYLTSLAIANRDVSNANEFDRQDVLLKQLSHLLDIIDKSEK